MRLAGEHEAGVEVALLQAVVLVHAHLAFQDLGAAGAAHAALARVGQVEAVAQRGLQERGIVAMELDLAAAAVEDDGDERLRRIARLDVMRRPGCPARRSAPDGCARGAGRSSRSAASTSSSMAPGPQTNASSMVSTGSSVVGEGLHLGGVEAAVEQLDVLMLAAEQVVEREAGRGSGPSGPPAPPGTSRSPGGGCRTAG